MNPPPPIPPPVPPPAYAPVPPSTGGAKKWVLYGCGGCLGLVLLGGVAMFAFFFFIFGAMKKSDIFVEAVKRAQTSAEVQAAIGTPMETGWMVQGNFNYENGSGTADFNIPIKGPKGEGTLIAVGQKAVGGPWVYSQLEAVLPDGTKIDLNSATPPAPPLVEAEPRVP